MKLKKPSGDFFAALALNLLFTWQWSLPAWILLILHFIFKISIWWFVLALAIWIFTILLWMAIIGWAAKCSSPEPYKENKNPYSAKNGGLPSNKQS